MEYVGMPVAHTAAQRGRDASTRWGYAMVAVSRRALDMLRVSACISFAYASIRFSQVRNFTCPLRSAHARRRRYDTTA